MAEFKVTLSEVTSAAAQVAAQAEEFLSQMNALVTASAELTATGGGWNDDASPKFQEGMEQMKTWATNMEAALQEYKAAMNFAVEKYTESDSAAAGFFKR